MNMLGNSENITVTFNDRDPNINYKKIPAYMTSIDVNPVNHNDFLAKCLKGIQEAGIAPSKLYIAVVTKLADYLIMYQYAEYLPEMQWTMTDAEALARTIEFDRSDSIQAGIVEAFLAVWLKHLLDMVADTFYISEVRAGDLIRRSIIYVMRQRFFDFIRIEIDRPKLVPPVQL